MEWFKNYKLWVQQFDENWDLKTNENNSWWIFWFGADDYSSPDYVYCGSIQRGTENWEIMRVSKNNNDVDYAKWDEDGLTNWNNRESLTYSKQI